METERSFTEGVAVPQNNPSIMDRSIINRMLASNAVDKRVMDDRAIGPRELDLDYSTIADGEVLSFALENGVLVLQAVPAANIGGVIPANASVDASKINTGSDTPMDLEFLQYTTSGLRWSAIPRQTNITADEIASGVIPTVPTSLPPTAGSVTTSSLADDFELPLSNLADITIAALPDDIPQSKLSLSLAATDLPTIPYSQISGTPTIPTSLVSPANSILPAQINAGGTAAAGKILKLTSTLAWAWADDNSGSGGGSTPANESVTEEKLDAHNDPTSGYALKWDTTNGLYWGEDNDTTYTIPTALPPTANSVVFASINAGTATAGQVLTYDGTALDWTDKSDTTIPDDSIGEVKLDIHNSPSAGLFLGYTSNGLEWVSALTSIADGSLGEAKLDIHNSPTSGYALKWDTTNGLYWGEDNDTTYTIPTALPPTNDSVGEAAINATDTPSDGEFLQVSIDNNGNRTLNWSAALTGAAGSITEPMLAIHNSPTDDYVLAWDNDNSRLYWKVDKDTTYTLPTISTLVNGTPTSDQVVAWDSTNSRAYWKDDADTTPSLSDLVTGTPSAGQVPSYSTTNSRWELANLPTTPTLQSLVNGTPTDDQVVAWDATNSRAYWKNDEQGSGGGGGGGSSADASNTLHRLLVSTPEVGGVVNGWHTSGGNQITFSVSGSQRSFSFNRHRPGNSTYVGGPESVSYLADWRSGSTLDARTVGRRSGVVFTLVDDDLQNLPPNSTHGGVMIIGENDRVFMPFFGGSAAEIPAANTLYAYNNQTNGWVPAGTIAAAGAVAGGRILGSFVFSTAVEALAACNQTNEAFFIAADAAGIRTDANSGTNTPTCAVVALTEPGEGTQAFIARPGGGMNFSQPFRTYFQVNRRVLSTLTPSSGYPTGGGQDLLWTGAQELSSGSISDTILAGTEFPFSPSLYLLLGSSSSNITHSTAFFHPTQWETSLPVGDGSSGVIFNRHSSNARAFLIKKYGNAPLYLRQIWSVSWGIGG